MFQPQFADQVESGKKQQTIRANARCKNGDTLSLRKWQDEPCKSSHVVLKEAECKSVVNVVIDWRGVIINGEYISRDLTGLFAQDDGFNDFTEMCEWLASAYGLPFSGDLIRW